MNMMIIDFKWSRGEYRISGPEFKICECNLLIFAKTDAYKRKNPFK